MRLLYKNLENTWVLIMNLDYKALYEEAEKERRQLSRDYLDLAKKVNIIDVENKGLRLENEKLRKMLNEQRKNNSEVIKVK